MLKILHFADLHLGTENFGKFNSKTGMNTRVEDFLKAFDLLVDKAIEEKVDLVIFAGDAFRDRNPSQTLQREFAKRLSKLVTAEIPVCLLVGNHDLPRVRTRANTLEIYKVLEIPGVTVIDQAEIVKVKTKKGYVQIAGIPWDYFLNLFLALKAEQKPGEKLIYLQELVEKQVALKIKDLAEKLEPDLPNILLAHLPLGVKFGSEQDLEIELDIFLNPKIVVNSAFDYVALGHMHHFQKLADDPLTIYPGSLERVDFSEKDQDKGFVIVELPQKKDKEGIGKLKKQTTSEFYPTSQRRFLEIKLDLSKLNNQQVLKLIEKQSAQFKGAIVKVILAGSKDQIDQIDFRQLNELLKTAHDYISQPKITDQKKSRSDLSVEMTPLKALEEYLKLQKIPDTKLDDLKKQAQKLIQELEHSKE